LKRDVTDTWGLTNKVPPGLTAGGGLKHNCLKQSRPIDSVPPGLTAGGGLKPQNTGSSARGKHVPPGLTAGGGLKLDLHVHPFEIIVFPPASPPGAD